MVFWCAQGRPRAPSHATLLPEPAPRHFPTLQLIASKHGGKPYSATAADVWACGVMLFAMLGGMFPYDHTGHPNPNSSGAHVEVRGGGGARGW